VPEFHLVARQFGYVEPALIWEEIQSGPKYSVPVTITGSSVEGLKGVAQRGMSLRKDSEQLPEAHRQITSIIRKGD
jgi:hypothetical protein